MTIEGVPQFCFVEFKQNAAPYALLLSVTMRWAAVIGKRPAAHEGGVAVQKKHGAASSSDFAPILT
jgi:hypothetical protein